MLLLAGAFAPARAARSPYAVFPRGNELFPALLADPRQIQLSAAYYRLAGRDTADVALGHSWGMARWYSDEDRWAWQWNIEAMAFSRFLLSGVINEFQTIDFFANIPLEVRSGPYSGKFMLFHESSHLGDDYIRRTRDVGFRYSIDGLRAVLAVEPFRALRLYGGATYLLHTIPSPKRGALQGGLELRTRELGLLEKYPTHAYLAQDVQSIERTAWNVNSRTVLGVQIGFKGALSSMRLQVGYFDGHSSYGQFFSRREHYTDAGINLQF